MAETKKRERPDMQKTFWQPPEKRGVASEEGKRWLEENAEAIQSSNDWVEKNGLPLEKYRPF